MGAAQVQNGVVAPSSASNQATATATATATHAVAASSPALNQATAPATTTAATETACEVSKAPKKKKICCACPDTKRIRDECIVEHGEDACAKWIEAHRLCLRAEGFNV
ncbi:cytochrome c oxidase copper chaperone 1-like [Vicia villosa]|uniref:cytochrome c oxidase copper chaperone 1-like n=1 Tax=Vicia villosa TaxID=3911 RepID=UPI00273CDED1|nr:cytochrome c oxidase copper chaperone 1-like [Vicia villosa]